MGLLIHNGDIRDRSKTRRYRAVARTELGIRTDRSFVMRDGILTLRGMGAMPARAWCATPG